MTNLRLNSRDAMHVVQIEHLKRSKLNKERRSPSGASNRSIKSSLIVFLRDLYSQEIHLMKRRLNYFWCT